MKPRLECPHCKKLFPGKWIWEQQFNCAHCRAPVRFCWPLRFVAYVTTVLVTVSLVHLLRPFWMPLAVLSSPGHIDRGSLTNFAIIVPQILPGFLLGQAILHRFGSLTLINPIGRCVSQSLIANSCVSSTYLPMVTTSPLMAWTSTRSGKPLTMRERTDVTSRNDRECHQHRAGTQGCTAPPCLAPHLAGQAHLDEAGILW